MVLELFDERRWLSLKAGKRDTPKPKKHSLDDYLVLFSGVSCLTHVASVRASPQRQTQCLSNRICMTLITVP